MALSPFSSRTSGSSKSSRNSRLTGWFSGGWALALALGLSLGSGGCVDDPDCGVCDPDNLYLQSITGLNYAGRKVHLLTTDPDASCVGSACPESVSRPKYYVKDLIPCEETKAALDSERPAEYCKISPLMTFSGVQFVFNNLLDPQSVELTRKHPEQPVQFEIYEWKSRIAKIDGPITRYNGDYVFPAGQKERSLRSVNLTCIEKLGENANAKLLEDPTVCDQIDANGIPLRMQVDGETKSFGGQTDTRLFGCTPGEGVNTCCDACSFEQAINVAKYGLDASGSRRSDANAIECTNSPDPFVGCRDFVPAVNRDMEVVRYDYSWGGETKTWRLPRYDKMRETHPDDRPSEHVRKAVHCEGSNDCRNAGLTGAACVGKLANGAACDGDFGDEACIDRMCQAEWFVGCKNDKETTGVYHCIDKRFKDRGAGACFVADVDFEKCSADDPTACTTVSAGQRLAQCDSPDYDSKLTAAECCQSALGGGESCDPLFQSNVHPIARYDRSLTIGENKRDCFCGPLDAQPEACAADVARYCTGEFGDLEQAGPNGGLESDPSSNAGVYTTRFVKELGGVVYDPSLKGVTFRPADSGAPRRALLEECASRPGGNVGSINYLDGWRRNDRRAINETFEDFDRAMCSGSTYNIEFGVEGEHVRDKRGNTLDGRSTYVLKTPQFHVEPGSGFPATRVGMGACGYFIVKFSNKYDMAPHNLNKIAVYELERVPLDGFGSGKEADGTRALCTKDDPSGSAVLLAEKDVVDTSVCWRQLDAPPVAGGEGCVADVALWDPSTQAPCLEFNVADQEQGRLWMEIGTEFGKVLKESKKDVDGNPISSGRYRVVVPSLADYASLEALRASNLAEDEVQGIYGRAFLDACGMPLINALTKADGAALDDSNAGAHDHVFDMRIKSPSCKDDKDFDKVERTCDNAKQLRNPGQEDADRDGVGDVSDFCATIEGDVQTDDPDKDGIGSSCDTCPLLAGAYNDFGQNVDPPPPDYMLVRNVPFQTDTDQDGVGDVCDNCPTVANCAGFGPSKPWQVGNEVPDHKDGGSCMSDKNNNWIGDACEVDPPSENAAGVIGFRPEDDFDQDGLSNMDDGCPRQPVVRLECTSDDACPKGAKCEASGICNHVDSDDDNFGDICDTCPYLANGNQAAEGAGQTEDADGDFVGDNCEYTPKCRDRNSPRPYAFWEYAVDGRCCVATYYMDEFGNVNPAAASWEESGDGWWRELTAVELGKLSEQQEAAGVLYKCMGKCDWSGFPIKRECNNEADPDVDLAGVDTTQCRGVPQLLDDGHGGEDGAGLFGVTVMPPGCAALMGTDDPNANQKIKSDASLPDNLHEWWAHMCFLPQWDSDFDGVADGSGCDMCPHSFDPSNAPFVSDKGKTQLRVGKYCNGRFDVKHLCEDEAFGDDGGGDDGDTGNTGG
ncbi:MAG: thrombospondin type 3 repeat-containing protein [Nannocystaceae bacterium]